MKLKNMNIYEREKYYKKCYYATITCFIIIVAFFLLFTINYLNLYKTNSQISKLRRSEFESNNLLKDKVFFKGEFTEKEEEKIMENIYDMKDYYTDFFDSMIFTKDLEQVKRYCDDEEALGCNSFGEIIIYADIEELTYYNTFMRDAICHEILHSIIYNNEQTHPIVYDLGQKQVCYDNTILARWKN